MKSRTALCITALVVLARVGAAQIIPFDSNGLKYQALTHNGVTIMVASLPTRVREYAILQVSVSNGSPTSWVVRPEDFRFESDGGGEIQAPPAKAVVERMLD